MDDRAFDRLTLALANGLSRRGLGRIGIAALTALGLHIDAPLAEVIAAPSKRRKRRKQDRRDAAKEGGRPAAAKKKKGKKQHRRHKRGRR